MALSLSGWEVTARGAPLGWAQVPSTRGRQNKESSQAAVSFSSRGAMRVGGGAGGDASNSNFVTLLTGCLQWKQLKKMMVEAGGVHQRILSWPPPLPEVLLNENRRENKEFTAAPGGNGRL